MVRRREDKTIGFRLGGKRLAELERQAEELGVSPGELSRAIVERHLEHDDSRAILETIEDLGSRLDALARALGESLSDLKEDLSGLRQDFERALREAS